MVPDVHACRTESTNGRTQLILRVGLNRKGANALRYRFQTETEPGRAEITFHADEGPLGIENFRIQVGLRPAADGKTYIRLAYSYQRSFISRMATAGKDKIGFTVIGQDDAGEPLYVQGVRGIVERNAMRYFLAVRAYLETLDKPSGKRLEARLQHWYELAQGLPPDLIGRSRADYLATKL